ncbi:efflux transporter periplasmic adaptor subunit [Limnohabitans sp. Rim8]|jgi:cobalt-zinc-cadmium efflux system membrane fusion protein|uniref:Efflux transporter periplasmic adaptor subunit n=1 Tax=Limnohabitans curvus TaxID=323423 RepID=A0A315G145_9BURK|nr:MULTISPECIES: efflux RND transporter periplasmic adaptor subunit [Limnohabitans]PUE57076.1 efflux transporter periplasmic adaptor subunit [Limnohabitans sp. Rim8]PUE59407.1 efflux transporter periplasmic adaptor subunit [Limnohabitans curvus]
MSIRQNLQDRLRQASRTLLDTPAKRYSAAGGVVALLVLAYALLNQEAPTKPPAPQPIVQGQQLRFPAGHPQLALLSTIEAKAAESVTIELPARLVWNEERTQRIYPAFAGRVLTLNADIGQTVNAGQVLATLASPEFGAAQADTAKAMADAQVADRALVRHQTLFEADVISRKELDATEADALRAKAELARAQARTRMYGSTNGVNQQLGLAATVRGVVVERNLSAGQEVRPDQGGPGNQALFVVSDPGVLWVQIDARESDTASLKPGTKISLTLPNFPGQTFEAKITAAGDFIDSNTRSIKVRAVIDNAQRLLKAEMLGTARIERKLAAGVLVPASAVQLRGTEQWAYVQTEPGVFEPRRVKLGYEGLQEVLIVDGVQANELVVKENSLLLAREFRNAQDEAMQHTPAPGSAVPARGAGQK